MIAPYHSFSAGKVKGFGDRSQEQDERFRGMQFQILLYIYICTVLQVLALIKRSDREKRPVCFVQSSDPFMMTSMPSLPLNQALHSTLLKHLY